MSRSHHDAPTAEREQRDIIALALRHIGMSRSVFYAPSIPREREASARFAHDLHLPDEEAILVLHDGTVFGSAEEGFLVTRERLCWKNPWESARQIAWSEIDPAAVKREVGKVILAGGEIALSGELVLGVSRFLLAMSGGAQGSELGPYRGRGNQVAERDVLTLPVERIVALARSLVGAVPDVFYAPSIPPAMQKGARAAHAAHLPPDEAIAVLYDGTFFGSAEEGFLLTSQRLCWKRHYEPATQLPWSVIDAETISAGGSYVEVMGGEMKVTSRGDLSGSVATLLRRLLAEAAAAARVEGSAHHRDRALDEVVDRGPVDTEH